MKYKILLIIMIVCIIATHIAYQIKINELKDTLRDSITQTDRAINNTNEAMVIIERQHKQILQLIEIAELNQSGRR